MPLNTNASIHLQAPLHLTHPMVPVTNPGGPATATSSPVTCPEPSSQCLGSYNWGGYAICDQTTAVCSAMQAAPGRVAFVTGTWTVPTITTAHGASCSDSENTWYDNSIWVGIDGLFSPSVEQTGTSADCFYGQTQYYAWYEFYPSPSFTISMTIHPGDQITASVSCSQAAGGATCQTNLKDDTTGKSSGTPKTFVPGALRESAEWIDESAYYLGFLALTHVTPLIFSNAEATVNGVTTPLAGFGTQVWWLVMVTFNYPYVLPAQQSSNVKAEPMAITKSGDSFTTNWVSSGP
jgi:hypothetical protein